MSQQTKFKPPISVPLTEIDSAVPCQAQAKGNLFPAVLQNNTEVLQGESEECLTVCKHPNL